MAAPRAASLFAAFTLALSGAALASEGMTILNEGDIGSIWRPVADTIALPGYPKVVADQSEDVCIGVGYLLKEDGSTSDFAVLSAWGSKTAGKGPTDPHFLPFSQNSLAAVQRWRFQSIAGDRAKLRPVYTAATFGFSTTGTPMEAVRGHCRIADLRGFIIKAQAEASKKNLNRGRLDRQRVEQPAQIPTREGNL